MEYPVPQFIDVEDKIFGPFTMKQFIFLAGGTAVCAVALLYLPLLFGILVAAPVGALTAALAFYKVNNRSFLEMIEAGFNFYTTNRLYLWKKGAAKPPTPAAPRPNPEREAPQRAQLGLSATKLHDLAWSLDVKDTEQK